MSALFLELARTVLFLSSSPLPTHSDWGWSPQWWSLPYMEKCKNSSCSEACHTQAHCVCCCCCWGWTSCTHMATLLPNLVLAKHLQRLESYVTDIRGVNPFSLLWFVPLHWSHPATTWFPSQTCPRNLRSRCQHMSTPLHLLLKADPCLEGDIEVTKPIPWCAYNLISYLSCSIF